jgi:PIN domain nuclease of toxin-antitoxin system
VRLLLDTNILIALANGALASREQPIAALLASPDSHSHVSAASLWEIAIKMRLGKLDVGIALPDLAAYFDAVGLTPLPITAHHAVAAVHPEPDTRDPFDRLLLAQCAVESLQLVTLDRALAAHPLVWHA